MPRRIDVNVPPDKTDALIARLRGTDGVTSITLQRGASVTPPGDVMGIACQNDAENAVFHILTDLGVTDGGSFQSSELRSLVSRPHQEKTNAEGSEPPWEEMGFFLNRETNPTTNFFTLMVLCGTIAAVGLWTDLVHLVIGAMILAPGFEPLQRIPWGFIAGPRSHTRRGLISTFAGYAALAAGAAVTFLVLAIVDPAAGTDLTSREWVRFWSSVSASDVVIAVLAGIAGIFTVTADRPVLTAGVMVALALIPAMTLTGMALAAGNVPLALAALVRWSVDLVAVIATTAAVLFLKQRVYHKRPAMA